MTITITITLMVTVSLPAGARPAKAVGSRNRRGRYE
jgi:hypothetical protein